MKKLNLLIISILLMIFTSCQKAKQENPLNRFKNAKLTKSAKELAKGNNQFAVDFYKNLEHSDKNIMFSPLSIYTALGMLYEGADENTAKEISKVLHLGENNYKNPQAFYDLMGTIYNYNKLEANSYEYDEEKDEEIEKKITPYKVNLANSMWIDKGFNVKKSYKAKLEKYFKSQSQNLDLQSENALKIINEWVKKQTRGKIPSIIDNLKPATRLVLLNTLYFKAPWADEFSKYLTKKKKFYLNNGQVIKTDMMSYGGERRKAFYENQFIKVLLLPYLGKFKGFKKDGTHNYKTYTMYLILPKQKNGLKNIEQNLNISQLQNWLDNTKYEEVIIEIPKFKFEFERNLSEILQKLGIKEAFSGNANFSKINSKRELFISQVKHKTFIAIDEEGTEATSVTAISEGVTEEARPKPKEFIANHPFIFVIREEESGAIIFMGRVSNPNEN